ncbi:MAG: HAD family hydrolase [Candidatus Eremiobacterota bacterium]
MQRCLLWDWDGVLADSLGLYFELYREVCRHFGKRLPIRNRQEFRDWYEPRWELNYLEMGFSQEGLDQALQFALDWLDYSKVDLFPGVPAMLAGLAAEVPMAIVSTTPSPMIRGRLQAFGLEACFRLITGGEDGSSEKVEKIRQTLDSLGCSVAETPCRGVMVGDTRLDIEAARQHGLRTVAVTYGWQSPARVLEAGPDRRVDRPEDLESVVRGALSDL